MLSIVVIYTSLKRFYTMFFVFVRSVPIQVSGTQFNIKLY